MCVCVYGINLSPYVCVSCVCVCAGSTYRGQSEPVQQLNNGEYQHRPVCACWSALGTDVDMKVFSHARVCVCVCVCLCLFVCVCKDILCVCEAVVFVQRHTVCL